MTDPEDSEHSRLRRFVEEMRKVQTSDTPEDVLARTRLDIWEPSQPIGSTTDVHEFVDATTGGRVRIATFQASLALPADYPDEWPFIPGRDVQYMEVQSGAETAGVLMWPEPDDQEVLIRLVHTAMAELGWHEHAVEEPSADARYEHLVWFHNTAAPADHQWRLLAAGTTEDISALMLSEIRPAFQVPQSEPEHVQ